MAFNPAAFVTPYTAVGASSKGAGAAFANVMQNARQQDISKGYLGLQTRQQDFNEKKYANEEIDAAHKALLGAIAGGDPDAVEAAANNMRAVGSRYGLTIDEIRSDRAQANVAGAAPEAGKALAEVERDEEPAPPPDTAQKDTTAEQEAFFGAKAKGGSQRIKPPAAAVPTIDADEEASNARINAALAADQPSPFTGMRPPGGTLPRAASVAEPAGASEAPLRGYTIRGPDGKPIYSVSPKDVVTGQRERVSAIFDGIRSQLGDQTDAAGLNEAERIAHGLVGVLTPQQAALKGLEHFEQSQLNRNKLEVVEQNRRPRWGGGGMGSMSGLMGKNEDRAESTDKYGDNIEQALQHRGIPASEQALSQAEGALLSGDPALQKDALKIILKARSGLTVSESERRSYSMVDGALPAISNAIAQWTGEPLDEKTIQSYLAIVRNMHVANENTAKGIIAYEQRKYEAQNRRKVPDAVLKERSRSLDPNAAPGAPEGTPPKKSAKKLY